MLLWNTGENTMNLKQLPRMIDLSCVKTEITKSDLISMVEMAKTHRFICCFAMPCYTEWLIEQLKDEADIAVGGTIGFPSGADMTETKVATARTFYRMGCKEMDMVLNVSALKSGEFALVENDIRRIREAVAECVMKVILEVAYLSDDEIKRASEIAVKCGADYVKTGTGWAGTPTTVRHIQLIHDTIGDSAKIKAAGGVHTLKDICKMVEAGCSRFGIGVRSAGRILEEAGLSSQ